MVTISEIRGSDVGSLGGLGQTKSGTVFADAEGSGYPKELRMGVKQPKAQVSQLQMTLASLGYNVAVTGIFDAATDVAVKALQEKLGFQGKSNGVYTQKLDELLQDVIARGQSASLAPTRKDAQRVATAGSILAPGAQTVSVAPSQIVPQVRADVPSGVMTSSDGGFFANLMAAARQQPALFAAGAVAIIAAVIFVPRLLAMANTGKSPVQVMGLGAAKKKRKPRKKSAAGKKFYVHFGDAVHHPMQTVSYKSKAEAQAAIRDAKADGQPARLQEA